MPYNGYEESEDSEGKQEASRVMRTIWIEEDHGERYGSCRDPNVLGHSGLLDGYYALYHPYGD